MAAKMSERKSHLSQIQVVELHMMDKWKYFPLTVCSGFTIRSALYPFTVIKTRLMVQKQQAMYKGTFDAFVKIAKFEGARGLYKGYWVSNLLIVPQVTYITTYEGVRHFLTNHNLATSHTMKSLIAGFCASLAGQTFMVPVDVISQHLMMVDAETLKKGNKGQMLKLGPLLVPSDSLQSPMGRAKAVVIAIYNQKGIKGFYKGYFASLALYAPNSAMWWCFYSIYCDLLADYAPEKIPRLMVQTVAAPLGGITTSLITNCMDTIRARIQVEGTHFFPTIRLLWKEEKMGMFVKGLSARLIQSVTFSVFIILGYESIKRISLLPEYQEQVRW